ncbi:MAG: GNAT family N-acetyltransferase [Solirubrobacteraceae bacterium]|nr:GNAT family N-acetyltransferase [Patulibacter sp.]
MSSTSIHDDPERRRLELRIGGDLAALITYGRQAGIVAICHTESEPGFKGLGYASQLVEHALDEARRNGDAVMPFCSFAARHIAERPEYVALVPEQYRRSFEVAPAGA